MGTKKKVSTQPQEDKQLLFNLEGNPTNPEESQRSEDSTGGEAINSNGGIGKGSSINPECNNNEETSKRNISPERSEKIRSSMEKLRETYVAMGGKEGIEKRTELLKALLQYRGGKEAALTLFRERISSKGYEGIEKSIIPIVEAYGTTKDKVALVVNGYFDMKRDPYNRTPIVSKKEANEIKAKVREQGREEMVAFMNALSLFDTLRFILPHFYKAKYSYLSLAYQSTIYFQTYEWLGKTEELFKSFASLVDPNKQEEFNELAKSYNSYLQTYQRFGELEEKSGDGWLDKQREDCLNYAEIITKEFCEDRLSRLKGAIEAIEEWIKDNGAEMFVSMELRDQIEVCKTETIQELQSKYYFSHLSYMEEEGETPTDADRKIAIFPEYNEVERNEETYKYIYKKLDGYKKTYK